MKVVQILTEIRDIQKLTLKGKDSINPVIDKLNQLKQDVAKVTLDKSSVQQSQQYLIQIILSLEFNRYDKGILKHCLGEVFDEDYLALIKNPINEFEEYQQAKDYPFSHNIKLYQKIMPLCQLAHLIENNGITEEHAFKLALIFNNEVLLYNYLTNFPKTNRYNYLIHDSCLFDLPDESACDIQFWLKKANSGKGSGLLMLNPAFRNILPDLPIIEKMITDSKNQFIKTTREQYIETEEYNGLDEKDQRKNIQADLSKKISIKREEIKQLKKDVDKNQAAYKKILTNPNQNLDNEARINLLKEKKRECSENLIKLAQSFSGLNTSDCNLSILMGFYEKYKQESSLAHQFLIEQGISNKSIAEFDKLKPQEAKGEIPDIILDGIQIGHRGYYLKKLDVTSEKGAAIAASLGKVTQCCQYLGGIGDACSKHGIESPHAGFYIMYQGDANKPSIDDKIMAQAWAWRATDESIVLDSIEAISQGDAKQAAEMFQYLGHKLVHDEQYPVSTVKTGNQSGITADVGNDKLITKRSQYKDYKGYNDSRIQYLLADVNAPYLLIEQVNNPQLKTVIARDTKQFITQLKQDEKAYYHNHTINNLITFAINYSPNLLVEMKASVQPGRKEELEELITVNQEYLQKINRDEIDFDLIKQGAYVNARNEKGRSALFVATKQLSKETLLDLIKLDANVDCQDKYGNTPLLYLLETVLYDKEDKSAIEIIELLIVSGADVNCNDLDENSPLIIAVKNNDFFMVRFLVEHGADIDIFDAGLKTPIAWAAKRGNQEIFNYLFDKKANTQLKTYPNKDSLLMLALAGENDAIIDKALSLDESSITKKNAINTTALHQINHNPSLFKKIIDLVVGDKKKLDLVTTIDKDNYSVLNWKNVIFILEQFSSEKRILLLENYKKSLLSQCKLDSSINNSPFLSINELKVENDYHFNGISFESLVKVAAKLLSEKELDELETKVKNTLGCDSGGIDFFKNSLIFIMANEMSLEHRYQFIKNAYESIPLEYRKKTPRKDLSSLLSIIPETQIADTIRIFQGDYLAIDVDEMIFILESLPEASRLDVMKLYTRHGNSLLSTFALGHIGAQKKVDNIKNFLRIFPEKDRIKVLQYKDDISRVCEENINVAEAALSLLPIKDRARVLLKKEDGKNRWSSYSLIYFLRHPNSVKTLQNLIDPDILKKMLINIYYGSGSALESLIHNPDNFKQAFNLYDDSKKKEFIHARIKYGIIDKAINQPQLLIIMLELFSEQERLEIVKLGNNQLKGSDASEGEFPLYTYALSHPDSFVLLLDRYTDSADKLATFKSALSEYKVKEGDEEDDDDFWYDVFAEKPLVPGSYFLDNYQTRPGTLIEMIELFNDSHSQLQALGALIGHHELFEKELNHNAIQEFISKLPHEIQSQAKELTNNPSQAKKKTILVSSTNSFSFFNQQSNRELEEVSQSIKHGSINIL